MSHPDDTAARIRELEIKVTFLENHIEAQDRVMLEQGQHIGKILQELKRLRDAAAGENAFPADERPPHY
mgnify:CR=1 FL=1